MRPTHIIEDKSLYLTNTNVNFIQKCPHKNIQNNVWPKSEHPMSQSSWHVKWIIATSFNMCTSGPLSILQLACNTQVAPWVAFNSCLIYSILSILQFGHNTEIASCISSQIGSTRQVSHSFAAKLKKNDKKIEFNWPLLIHIVVWLLIRIQSTWKQMPCLLIIYMLYILSKYSDLTWLGHQFLCQEGSTPEIS